MAPAAWHDIAAMAEKPALAAAILGSGLPYIAGRHLRLAARSYRSARIAEAHLWRAQALAPTHAAVLIGLYRFYFYQNRLAGALNIARICLRKAARDNGLPGDWGEVRPPSASFRDSAAALPPFCLFTLKACAYLSMRLGDLEAGRAIAAKLLE